MRVIFAGTPDFACPALSSLVANHEVVAVFTQPDRKAGRGKKLQAPPVKQLALEHGLPIHQPLKMTDSAELIKELDADVMVVVAYGMILPESILALPRLGCLNIHASLLPRWRGAAPIQRAIEAGDQETGVAIMQMDVGLDTGPVFKTLTTAISMKDTSQSLHDRLAQLGAEGLLQTLEALSMNPEFEAVAQQGEAVYAKKITKAEGEIDWSLEAQAIANKVRAFNPWPVCYSFHQGERIRVWQAQAVAMKGEAAPGEIVSTTEGVQVACGVGSLLMTRLQRDNGKPLDFQEFLNGYQFNLGERLGRKDAREELD